MNRRESLKALGITAVSAGVLVDGCKTKDSGNEANLQTPKVAAPGRQEFEVERNERLKKENFFTDHEMATITILGDMIIPKDERSGSASDAGVPQFIAFMVKDIPDHQVPMRGGLRWLDMQCFNRYNASFKDATKEQQFEMVSDMAYPEEVKPGMEPGVTFFNRMRDLTASGFYTSEMGIKDLGYVGNSPNQWTGVPAEVLQQYHLEKV